MDRIKGFMDRIYPKIKINKNGIATFGQKNKTP